MQRVSGLEVDGLHEIYTHMWFQTEEPLDPGKRSKTAFQFPKDLCDNNPSITDPVLVWNVSNTSGPLAVLLRIMRVLRISIENLNQHIESYGESE